jgi:hypothetical protein
MGREIAIHDLIPLNLLGLFFGTYTLHHLVYTGDIQNISVNFFQGSTFTLILLALLVVMSVMSIAFSSRYFSSQEEVLISVGYLVPFLWFYFHSTALVSIPVSIEVCTYLVIAAAYFWAWYFLRPLETSRYQHVAAYVGGMIALVFAVDSFLGDYELYASLLIAYIGLIFAIIYVLDGNKGERILAAFLFSLF